VNFVPKNNIYPIQIREFDTLKAYVTFKPAYIGDFIDTIVLKTSPCGEEINIIVKGKGINTAAQIMPKLISGTVYNYSSDTASITITNTGTEPITITAYNFNPPLSKWNVSLIPALPQTIDPGDTLIFDVTFSTKQDSSLLTRICFETEAACPVELCTDINYQSINDPIAILPNPLDFGLITCTPSIERKTIIIENLSAQPARIDSIYILPDSAGFSITSIPKMPHFIPVGKNLELEIQFKPTDEGVFKAEIIVVGEISESHAELKAEFMRIAVNPLSIKTAFSPAERCHAPLSRTFTFWNTGMLTDTLDVSFVPPTAFYYADKNLLVIPHGDSADITISFDPSKAPEGTTKFNVILQSRVCTFFHTGIYLSGTVYEPHLALQPNPLAFPNVWPGDTLNKQVIIRNNSEFDIVIKKLTIPVNPNNYTIQKSLPFTINNNDSATVSIQFIGIKPGKYVDSLYINYAADCDYDTLLLLNPSVTEEIYEVNLSIPDYESQPYEDISISINLNNPVPKFRPDSVMIELSFDPWLLVPSDAYFVSGNSMIEIPSLIQPGFMQLSIPAKFADTMFLNQGTKISINGFTYPSSPNKTPLTFTNIEIYTEKTIDLSEDDGSLEIIPVCHPTGRLHLILSDYISVVVRKNIISDALLSLEINSTATTNGTLSVYSAAGSQIYSASNNFKKGNNKWNIYLDNIANGTYYFVLYSSTGQVFTQKFIIIR
jgi:hypothetical protein